MTGDILKYRIPGNSPVDKCGSFIPVDSLQDKEGFIVQSFKGDRRYLFVEGTAIQELHFSKSNFKNYNADYYLKAGEVFLEAFKSGLMEKGVLSRPMIIEQIIDAESIYNRLLEHYSNAFVYLISSDHFGTWIGASPELLLSSEGVHKTTVALAGTRKAEDGEPWCDKEQREHEYVADHISKVINRYADRGYKKTGPETIQAGPVKHLKTTFLFTTEVADEEILNELHPTPAIAGTPTDTAVDMILRNEGYDRELYTGFLGMIGSHSKVYVNLRCMQVFENQYVLYLGGGWTKDSVPSSEFSETENKAATLLQVINKK